jgi:hypothetical protein
MDLLNALMGAAGFGGMQKLGDQFGLEGADVEKVLGGVVPALGGGLKRNTASAGGLDALMGALQSGGHQRYVDDPGAAASASGIAVDNNILGHILGSKGVSRNLAAKASESSGVSQALIKQMLPMVATMMMGALSKQTDNGQQVQQLAGGGDFQSMLGSMLDSDGDGSAVDDVLDLAKKFF